MKPEEILEIADKNGFDWWGKYKGCFTDGISDISVDDGFVEIRICSPVVSDAGELEGRAMVGGRAFSLADLATNKSFLNALGEVWREKHKAFPQVLYFQSTLIEELTKNTGKDFWKICSEFIGEKK